MAKKIYAIMGATGQIGHVLVEYLLQKGHQVRAIGRHPQKLDFLQTKGAEVCQIDSFENETILTRAFKGVEAVFGMIPPGLGVDDYGAYQDRVGEAIKKAVLSNSISYLINLSSIGAQVPEGTGPIKGLYRQEQRLKNLQNINVLHIRPSYFMENLMWSIPSILHTGSLRSPLSPEIALPFIATPDIGMKVGHYLDSLNFKGNTIFEYIGPRTLDMVEATKILGNEIEKPDLQYIQLSYEEFNKNMINAGMNPLMVDLLVEMYRSLNENTCLPSQEIGVNNKGSITIEQFAKFFATAYKHAAQQKATL